MTAALLIAVVGALDSSESERSLSALETAVDRSECRVAAAETLADVLGELGAARFVSFLIAGEAPASGAVDAILRTIAAQPELDVLYGDEWFSEPGSREMDSFHKPAFSPERLIWHDYLGPMVTYRASFVAGVDTSMEGTPADQLHHLGLQAASGAAVVVHVPKVLGTRAPASDVRPGVEHVQQYLDREGWPARAVVSPHRCGGRPLLDFEPVLGAEPPLVSVIIPTGGSTRTVRGETFVMVDNAIRSLVEQSSYPRVEIVVVVDAKSTDDLAVRLRGLDHRVRVVKDERPFNFAAACNLGVWASSGSVVVLLNDDTEVVSTDWLERLVVFTASDDVGAVGVKLLYADGRLQHGGVATRDTGPDHLYHGYPGDDPGHGGWLVSAVNSFAATGACLAIRRDHWDAVGGMDERFPLNYNDIDLCLRLHSQGWRTVVDNRTVLTHLETSSRPAGSEGWEVDLFRERWGPWLDNDPYDNPNLVTVGLQQIPPPAALTSLAEYRGADDFLARVWRRRCGFGISVAEPLSGEQ